MQNSPITRTPGFAANGAHYTGTAKLPLQGDGFVYLDASMLLQYCQIKLREADTGIQAAMSGLDNITKVQQALTNLRSSVGAPNMNEEGRSLQVGINLDNTALNGGFGNSYQLDGKTVDPKTTEGQAAITAHRDGLQSRLNEISGMQKSFTDQVEDVAKQLEAIGQSDAADSIRKAGAKAATGSKEDQDAFVKTVDAQASSIGASREMAMVRLQALVSQRGTMLQMVTNMMNSLNEAAKNIAANTGR
jgi:hypothetical protein